MIKKFDVLFILMTSIVLLVGVLPVVLQRKPL